jgi:hypothetical protein
MRLPSQAENGALAWLPQAQNGAGAMIRRQGRRGFACVSFKAAPANRGRTSSP